MLIRRAEVAGRRCDVRLAGDRIVEIRDARTDEPRDSSGTLDAAGGALLPGLHDHHLHLFALAAAMASVACGPPDVSDRPALERALRRARAQDGWLRGTAYYESVAGPLDRNVVDALRDDVPVRIQHRSGVMWFLNSAAVEALDLEQADHPSIERDSSGRATGRLFRADDWLRQRLGRSQPPDLTPVGERLARYGITAVTDCTPTNDPDTLARFAAARRSGALPQLVKSMGSAALDGHAGEPGVAVDAHKIMLDEPALPDLDTLAERIRAAHRADRAVAFHVVTRTELLFTLAALDVAGARPGDRLEHASVAPPDAIQRIRALGLTVVTQPNFVAERGDAYRSDVEARDRADLYRVASWLDAGVALGGGTDAPFGDPDPWRAMRAAVERTTASGAVLGESERVGPEQALALFQAPLGRTQAPARDASPTLRVGDRADLCLLAEPWRIARESLERDLVAATWIGGRPVFLRDTTLQSGHRAEASTP